jgi:hypothetical protein
MMDKYSMLKEITRLTTQLMTTINEKKEDKVEIIRRVRIVYNDGSQQVYNFTDVKFIEVNF